jgi:hypothetical protein
MVHRHAAGATLLVALIVVVRRGHAALITYQVPELALTMALPNRHVIPTHGFQGQNHLTADCSVCGVDPVIGSADACHGYAVVVPNLNQQAMFSCEVSMATTASAAYWECP